MFQEKTPYSDAERVAKSRKRSNIIWSFESPENEQFLFTSIWK